MPRNLKSRLSTACAALVFAATGGLTGMQAHPLSPQGTHPEGMIALGPIGVSHHSDTAPTQQRAGHPQHEQGSSEECTCVGPCQGGVSPTLPDASSAELVFDEIGPAPVAPIVVFSVREDPSSYLSPLPNAPPQRV